MTRFYYDSHGLGGMFMAAASLILFALLVGVAIVAMGMLIFLMGYLMVNSVLHAGPVFWLTALISLAPRKELL